jgi:hypothetical protein
VFLLTGFQGKEEMSRLFQFQLDAVSLKLDITAMDRPAITLDIGEGVQAEPVELHTVQIRADDNEVDLVWRAAFPYAGMDWLPQMKKADVTING